MRPAPVAASVTGAPSEGIAPATAVEKKRKRTTAKAATTDELDAIFASASSAPAEQHLPSATTKEARKAAKRAKRAETAGEVDEGLSSVLGAIRESAGGGEAAADKAERKRRKKAAKAEASV